MAPETIYALTSLPPFSHEIERIRACLQTWQNAGLEVRSFNHPTEIHKLARWYDIEFVSIEETSISVFGKHFIPIHSILDWAAERGAPTLLINADIELQLAPWEVNRIRWLSESGLCYIVRFNHQGNIQQARREPAGIDAFFFNGKDLPPSPVSFLSMGQPHWDYWLPHHFASLGKPIYTLEFPVALHRSHPNRWSWQSWHQCAIEFARIAGLELKDDSFETCQAMSQRVRQAFDRHKNRLPRYPGEIQNWVHLKFSNEEIKTFLEFGAHRGFDSAWMVSIPGVTLYSFEPDPRNHPALFPNVHHYRAAIAERDGRGSLILSQDGWGQEWTYSSSIKEPKNHLHRFPVTFGETVEVEYITLDTFYNRKGVNIIDFIWADIQGAEGDIIRGGMEALAHTRYLFTEYSDDELYEDQVTLKDILNMLPDYRVIELWPDDVLLENQKLKDR